MTLKTSLLSVGIAIGITLTAYIGWYGVVNFTPVTAQNSMMRGKLQPGVGSALTSGATITPTHRVHHVTGTGVVATIATTNVAAGDFLILIPDGVFTTTIVGGNVGLASTAVVGKILVLAYDGTSWWPVY